MFVVDNAQFVDAESWGFFFDFFSASNAILVLAMRLLTSVAGQTPCDEELKILDHGKTKRIFLGKHFCEFSLEMRQNFYNFRSFKYN